MPDDLAVLITTTLVAAYILAVYFALGIWVVLLVGLGYMAGVKLVSRWWGFPPPVVIPRQVRRVQDREAVDA